METNQDHGWVEAAPFRAHVRHLCASSGLPWQLVGVAAGVGARQMETLMRGRAGRPRPRLRHVDARRLLGLTPQALAQRRTMATMAHEPRRLVELLGGPGEDLAARLGIDPVEMAALGNPRAGHVSQETLWRLRAACGISRPTPLVDVAVPLPDRRVAA